MNYIKKHYLLLLQIIFIISIPVIISSGIMKYVHLQPKAHTVLYITFSIIRCLLIIDVIRKLLSHYYTHFIKIKQDEKRANKKLVFISITTILLMCEIVFTFIPQSQKVQKFGLANYTWNIYYKQAQNEMGYRDAELKNRMHTNAQKVFFLGDSYTYGDGIKHNEDRFTDIIKAHLIPKRIEVFNLGKSNIDTRDEYINLISFGVKPDIMVLQYYLNDIEKIGEKYKHFNMNTKGYANKKESKLKKVVLGILLFPAKISYFINYTALNITKFLPVSNHNAYKECINSAYKDTTCTNEHKRDIQDIIDYCNFYKVKLYVLFVPDLRDIEYSQEIYTAHIVPLLKKNHIKYITIDRELKKYELHQIIVNPLNPHTNELGNQIMARVLLDSIEEFK